MGQQPCLPPQEEREVETPTLEEILPKPADTKVFSIVDAKCRYWSVVLDKESSCLTTLNFSFGRYRFKHMLFGIKMSQNVFHTKRDQTFKGCEGVIGIADEMTL